jgi:hypothetical protein
MTPEISLPTRRRGETAKVTVPGVRAPDPGTPMDMEAMQAADPTCAYFTKWATGEWTANNNQEAKFRSDMKDMPVTAGQLAHYAQTHKMEDKLEPTKTRTIGEIAWILMWRVVLSETTPVEICLDNAKEFRSEMLKKLGELAGISIKHSSPYNAHANGKVERQNIPLVMAMRTITDDFKGAWSETLPFIEQQHNIRAPAVHQLL